MVQGKYKEENVVDKTSISYNNGNNNSYSNNNNNSLGKLFSQEISQNTLHTLVDDSDNNNINSNNNNDNNKFSTQWSLSPKSGSTFTS